MAQDKLSGELAQPGKAMGRRCFVTVGATASFQKLLGEVLEPRFLACLGSHGFEELVVQTGPDHDWAIARIEALGTQQDCQSTPGARWPVIQAVSYTADLQSLMLPCRGDASQRRLPGAMISHGGSGSILDAVRCDVPLIVVANPDLLGNHQEELVDAVDDAGWAVKGTLGHLGDAIIKLAEKTKDITIYDISPYHPPPFPTSADERCGLVGWAAFYAEQNPAALYADQSPAAFYAEPDSRAASPGVRNLTLD